jgi:multidrug resistance efflux pump
MVDDAPLEPEVSPAEPDVSDLPAPVGRMLLFLTIALLSSLAVCWCFRTKGALPETGTITGQTTPLISNWKGRISRFWVKSGDSVQAGDPIAVLLNEQLLLEIDRQQREVDEIQRSLDRAEQSADERLTSQLLKIDAEIVSLKTQAGILTESQPDSSAGQSSSVIPRIRELEAARMNAARLARESLGLDRINVELMRAEARLRHLLCEPREITLPAPVSGTIGKLLRKPGERVVAGTPLLELADKDQPFLVVEMPEPSAKMFALGDTIPLNCPGRQSSIGRVADMFRMDAEETGLAQPADVRWVIEPIDEDWPAIPLQSPVRVRTSDSNAMSRRIN